MVCWCRKLVSLLCLFFVLPFLVWLFKVLAAQNSDGHDPKLVEALLFASLRVREAEMEAVSTLVRGCVGHLFSVAAPVAALVTSSHAPLLWNAMRTLVTCRLGTRVFRFSSLNVPSSVSAVMVHGIKAYGSAMELVHVSSGQGCFLVRDRAGQVVCGFLVHPDRDLELLGSALTSRSTSVWCSLGL